MKRKGSKIKFKISGGGLIYCRCTSVAEDRGRLATGSTSAWPMELGFSDRVSQLLQAAASSTPTGLGGAAGSSAVDCFSRANGHVSIRYSCISWWQLLTISFQKNKTKRKAILLHRFQYFSILRKKQIFIKWPQQKIKSYIDTQKNFVFFSNTKCILCLCSH